MNLNALTKVQYRGSVLPKDIMDVLYPYVIRALYLATALTMVTTRGLILYVFVV